MFSRFSRIVISLALVASLWTTAIAVAAAPLQQQSPPPQQQQSGSEKQSTQKDASASTTTVARNDGRPLSANEDPRMIGKRNINKGVFGGGSLEKEVALGRQLAAEVDRQAKFIEDPVITEYINRVGQNVVLHSDAKIPFTIKVLDSDEANAFALPGGFFYVNKGLILAADNEAEMAGVMAHEIAHVTARHAVENQTKGMWLQGLAIAGSIFLGGVPGLIINNLGGLGMLAAFLKFSRGAEEEADKLGAQYLYAAGYDPNAQSTMFEKLLAKNKKKPGLISKAFSTHPQTADRMQASRALVARFPDREEYVVSTSEFQRVKGRLLRLSNARASATGDISGGGDGTSGRPTLKRRQPTPDDTTTTTPGSEGQKPSEERPSDPPKLKRTPDAATTTPAPSVQP